MLKDTTSIKTGLIGTVVAALCCFTPVLVVMLGVVRLSALTGRLDLVLMPALVFFVGLTVYAVHRRHRNQQYCDTQCSRD